MLAASRNHIICLSLVLLLALLTTALACVLLADSPLITQLAPRHSDPEWRALHWNNTDLAEIPVLQDSEPSLGHEWGEGLPTSRIHASCFSAHGNRQTETAPVVIDSLRRAMTVVGLLAAKAELKLDDAEKKLVKRRDFMRGLAKTFLLFSLIPSAHKLPRQAASATDTASRPAQGTGQSSSFALGESHQDGGDSSEQETDSTAFDLVDLGTGAIIAEEFGRHVFWNGVKNGTPLNPTSASEMLSLSAGRIAALRYLGGEQGAELAQHEQAEIMQNAFLPVGVLTILADWANTHFQFDNIEAYGPQFDAELIRPGERERRPDIETASREEWEAYRQEVDSQIVEQATEIAASTSALAGLGTTYASSALANRQKQQILQALYEKSYAEVVLDNEVCSGEMIHQLACEKADELMSGDYGYSKLMLTLTANVNGTWGIGDPPQLYMWLRNPNLPTFAVEETAGLALSELSTLATNIMWLKTADVLSDSLSAQDAIGKLLSKQIHMAKIIVEKNPVAARMRESDAHLSFAETLTQAVEGMSDEEAKSYLQEFMNRVPRSVLEPNMTRYLQRKMRVLARIRENKEVLATVERFAASLVSTDSHTELEDLYGELKKSGKLFDPAYATKLNTLLEEHLERLNLDAMDQIIRVPPEPVVEGDLPAAKAIADESKVELYRDVLQRIVGETRTQFETSLRDVSHVETFVDLMEALHIHASGMNPQETLRSMPETLRRQAMAEWRSARRRNGAHNGPRASEDHRGSRYNQAIGGILDGFELNENAREVLFALLTQVPSVPAFSQLARRGIWKAVSLSEPYPSAKMTPRQLEYVLAPTLFTEQAMSTYADNVAAYIFGGNVLSSLLIDTFGKVANKPYVRITAEVISNKIAEMAGNGSLWGNGPNFLQDEVLLDRKTTGKVHVLRGKPAPRDLMIDHNRFALGLNVTALVLGTGVLWNMVHTLEKKQTQVSRRDLLKHPSIVFVHRQDIYSAEALRRLGRYQHGDMSAFEVRKDGTVRYAGRNEINLGTSQFLHDTFHRPKPSS